MCLWTRLILSRATVGTCNVYAVTLCLLWLHQTHSHNLTHALRNTANSYSQHGPATPWLTSQRPANVTPMPQTLTVMAVIVVMGHIIKPLGQSIKQGRLNTKLLVAPFFRWNEETCELHDHVFETKKKWLQLRALCVPPYQMASSPPN